MRTMTKVSATIDRQAAIDLVDYLTGRLKTDAQTIGIALYTETVTVGDKYEIKHKEQ